MITLITGPMYSGKTVKLFQIAERAKYAKKKKCLIKAKKDIRKNNSHKENDIDIVKLFGKDNIFYVNDWNDEDKLIQELKSFDVIFIDEFMLIKNNLKLIYSNIDSDLYFSGLMADSDAKIWEETSKILPYADDIKHLSGICVECNGELGNYSYYHNGKKQSLIEVGNEDKYICLCRKCYFKKVNI